MKVLYASHRPPFPFFLGGAARSAHYLLSGLVHNFDVQVLAVGSADYCESEWSPPETSEFDALGITDVRSEKDKIIAKCDYPVQVLNVFPASLVRVIDRFEPDVVWTQLDGFVDVAEIAMNKGIKAVVFLRDAEDPIKVLRALAKPGCGIVCNSHFMAKRIWHATGKQARVIYPSLESSLGATGDPLGLITMINPSQVKGISTFWEIARRMPDERFLLVESWTIPPKRIAAIDKKLAEFPNVRFLRRRPNVGDVYSQTKLLLVPSIWEEAFGRVVIEAQSCGIPVVASKRGGLPEAVGEGGVCVDGFRNPARWVEAIRSLLETPGEYNKMRERAFANADAEKFTSSYAARKLYEICNDDEFFQTSSVSVLGRFAADYMSPEGLFDLSFLKKMLDVIRR